MASARGIFLTSPEAGHKIPHVRGALQHQVERSMRIFKYRGTSRGA